MKFKFLISIIVKRTKIFKLKEKNTQNKHGMPQKSISKFFPRYVSKRDFYPEKKFDICQNN